MPETGRQSVCRYVSSLWDDPSLRPLVLRFLERLPGIERELRCAADAEDIVRLAGVAHKVKGALGLHGFAEVAPYAASVSAAAKTGDLVLARRSIDELAAALRDMLLIVDEG